MKQIICTGLILGVLMSTAVFSFAKPVITPSLAIKETYNDNIFLTSSDEEDDFITTASPRIDLQYSPNKSLDLQLDYSLSFRSYSGHDDLNDTNLRETQNINFKAQARPLSRVFIDVSDVYRRVPIDIRRKTADENEFFNKTENNEFSISPYAVLPLTSTLTTTLGYRYGNSWYHNEDSVDSESHSAFFILDKKFTSKVNGSLKYNYYTYRPDIIDDSDIINRYDRHEGSAGFVYQIRPEFQVRGEAGQAWFDYESLDDRDYSFWNIGTDYTLQMAGNTSLGVGYSTYFKDSSVSGVFRSRRFDLNFKTGTALKLAVNAYHTIDKYLDTDRKDKITGAVMGISRPLSKRVVLSFNGSWEKQEFLPEEISIHKYGAGAGIAYTLRDNISIDLGYRYNERDAETAIDEYQNNIAWLQAKITF